MNRRAAKRIALLWLAWACDDPESYFELDDWLPEDEDPEVARDKIIGAFADLKAEMRRRSGERD